MSKIDSNHMLAKHLGEVVATLRKERCITQVQLSKLTGIPQSTITRIEVGASAAKFETIHLLILGMGCRLADFSRVWEEVLREKRLEFTIPEP